MAASLNTPYAILSYPHVFEKKPRSEGGDPKYTASFIFNPAAQKSPAYKAMQEAVVQVAQAKFGVNVKMSALMLPFKDAGEKETAGYNPGDMYINTWSDNKPGVVDAQRNEVLLKEEVWAGQLVRANVTPFAWEKSGKRGVTFGLNHIQIVRSDTPRIDGRVSAGKAFDDGLVDAGEENMF